MSELESLWLKFSCLPFPSGLGGEDVNGICLASLDASAAGCINVFMKNMSNGLDIERIAILKRCKFQCEQVLDVLNDESLDYFLLLHDMCENVLYRVSVV